MIFTATNGKLYETASIHADADDFILKTASIPSLISRLRADIRRHELGVGKRRESEKVLT